MTTNKAAAVVSEEQVSIFFAALHVWEAHVFGEIKTLKNGARIQCVTAALQAALGVGGWRPMDSAPKGRPILVHYRNDLGRSRVVKASFVSKHTEEAGCDQEFCDYHEETDTYYTPEGWYEQVDNWDDYTAIKISHEPDSWQPLPPPPSSEEG